MSLVETGMPKDSVLPICISPEYAALNRQLHEERLDYGSMGSKHADSVRGIAQVYDCRSLLDYGCGNQTLLEALRLPWARGYDPCVPGLDGTPEPADLVVCTDTLEHVEPECIEAVLDHIRSLSKRLLYVSISLRPPPRRRFRTAATRISSCSLRRGGCGGCWRAGT
jgi:hypothetical protein